MNKKFNIKKNKNSDFDANVNMPRAIPLKMNDLKMKTRSILKVPLLS